jgi:hypothetical protein
MPKQINVRDNASMSELDWKPGELIGFDNTDLDFPHPFLLAIPKKIVRGFDDSMAGLRLLYSSARGEREKWTLYFEGNLMELWEPYGKNYNKPKFRTRQLGFSNEAYYVVEYALSGREVIRDYFEKDEFLNFYAKCMKSGRLITERSALEKVVEERGFGMILPNLLRFRK